MPISKPTFLVVALVAVSTDAMANVRIHNATDQELTLECTLPNGAVTKDTMYAAIDSIDDGNCDVPSTAKTVAVRAVDDEGKAVWSATIKDNSMHLLVAGSKAVEAVPAGMMSVPKESPRVALMDLTGEKLKLDLTGTGGVGAHRGIAAPTRFEPKKALKLDARETYFTMTGANADGEVSFDMDRVTAGNYYVVWKVPRSGKYRAVQLGRL